VKNKLGDATQRILAAALHLGNCSIVAMLLQRPDVGINEGERGFASIHTAARDGCVDVMKVLLSHEGIDVNRKTLVGGRTPLLVAASKGKSGIVGLLLAQPSIETNASNDNEVSTPLYIATKNGHVGVVKQLVAHETIDLSCLN
jgi:ankyrin repeat protein